MTSRSFCRTPKFGESGADGNSWSAHLSGFLLELLDGEGVSLQPVGDERQELFERRDLLLHAVHLFA